jgi:hypothetical protein
MLLSGCAVTTQALKIWTIRRSADSPFSLVFRCLLAIWNPYRKKKALDDGLGLEKQPKTGRSKWAHDIGSGESEEEETNWSCPLREKSLLLRLPIGFETPGPAFDDFTLASLANLAGIPRPKGGNSPAQKKQVLDDTLEWLRDSEAKPGDLDDPTLETLAISPEFQWDREFFPKIRSKT